MARLAPVLLRGRAVIDSRWPHRDRASDGWIGDPSHQGRVSDHNENSRHIVDAIDVDMFGGPDQVHRPSIVAGAILHPSVHYVIFDRRIFNREDRFRPRVYHGINPHTGHCHVSIQQAMTAENSTAGWPIWAQFPRWAVLRQGMQGVSVLQLQAYLNAWGGSLVLDGAFGPATLASVKGFQHARAITVDGIVGPQTRGKLFG